MRTDTAKPKRGRPKTFQRSQVLAVAMQAYWQEGHAAVSVNAICQRAAVAKTSLYKEFGSEDGLMQAVLCDYHAMTLAPLLAMLGQDTPFPEALDAFTAAILQDHDTNGMPRGCLFVDMCHGRAHLGALTGAQVDTFRALSLSTYERWIKQALANQAIDLAVSPRMAALYIDAQIATAMDLQRQGAPQSEVAAVFRLAMSVFR